MAYKWFARGEVRLAKFEIRRINQRGRSSSYKEIQASSWDDTVAETYTLLDKDLVEVKSYKHTTEYINDEHIERIIMTSHYHEPFHPPVRRTRDSNPQHPYGCDSFPSCFLTIRLFSQQSVKESNPY